MSNYRKPTTHDRRKTVVYLLLGVAIVAGSGALLLPAYGPIGLAVWLVVFVGGVLFLLASWHAQATAYRCTECGHEFDISPLTDFLSPHYPYKKYLRCPRCGKRTWTTVLMKAERS